MCYDLLYVEDSDVDYDLFKEAIEEKSTKIIIKRLKDGKTGLYECLEKYKMVLFDIHYGKNEENYNGIESAKIVSKLHPGMPIIITTGFMEKYKNKLDQLVNDNVIITYYQKYEQRNELVEKILEIINSKKIKIMQISDLHITYDYTFLDKTLSIDDMVTRKISNIKNIDILVFSGDLTQDGHKSCFDMTYRFITKVMEESKLHNHQIVCVPGNHDYVLSEKSYYKFRNYLEFIEELYSDNKNVRIVCNKNYHMNSKVIKGIESTDESCIFTIFIYEELSTIILALNSVSLEKSEGEISLNQLAAALAEVEEIENSFNRNMAKIAVLHHNIFSVPDFFQAKISKMEITNRGILLDTLLRNKYKLLFHGHSHYSSVYKFFPYHVTNRIKYPSQTVPSAFIISSGALSGDEKLKSLPYFSFNEIDLTIGLDGEPLYGTITPHLLMRDSCEWDEKDKIRIEF